LAQGTVISSGTVSSCACEASKLRKQEHGSADIPDHHWSQSKPASLNRIYEMKFGHFTSQ